MSRVSAVLTLGWTACGEPTAVAPPPSLDGWPAEIAREPAKFTDLMARTDRDGWIAWHAHDLPTAWDRFSQHQDAVPKGRVALDYAVLYEDLDAIVDMSHERLFRAWDHRGGLPAGGAASIAVLNARCHGRDPSGWARRVAAGAPGSTWVALPDEDALWPVSLTTPEAASDPFLARRVLHRRARDGAPEDLQSAASVSFFLEPGDGFEREFWDPCALATLTRVWRGRAEASLGVPIGAVGPKLAAVGLEGALFSPWLQPSDVSGWSGSPGLLGSRAASLAPVGITPEGSVDDDVEVARSDARHLAEALDAWSTALKAAASPEGRAIVDDLALMDHFAQDWLVARARAALAGERPRQALTYAQLARDPSENAVGVRNSASVYAVLARAELANGHAREALDALAPLIAAHPEATGAREVVADLTVLEGLDRLGDSKEN